MEKIEIQVMALSSSETSPGNFSLVLETTLTRRRMAIIIGAAEAQSIAIYMERMQLPRPLTHDLFKNTLTELGVVLKEVILHNIINGMFYAWLVLETGKGEEKKIDARASDALALAVRFHCPVYVYKFVLEEAVLAEEVSKKTFLKGSVAEYTLPELHSLLADLLAKEDYESASRVRDMIKRREEGGAL